MPYALIDEASEVGKALRGALEAISEPDEAKARLIAVLSAYPVTGKPRRTWRSDAEAALTDLKSSCRCHVRPARRGDRCARLSAVARAPTSIYFASPVNEAFLCATTVLASRAAAGSARDDSADLLSRLRQLALKAITIIGGATGNRVASASRTTACRQSRTRRCPRPSPSCSEPSAAPGTALCYGQFARAIEALAAAQGLTRDELLEMAVEDHGLGSDGTGRAQLAEGWLAVIQRASVRPVSATRTPVARRGSRCLPR